MSKQLVVEALTKVLDGEVVVTWSNPVSRYPEDTSPARKRVREMEEANRENNGPKPTFTVHKGNFKFHYRKSLWIGENEEGEPVVSGEFFLDSEWSRKVFRTEIVL